MNKDLKKPVVMHMLFSGLGGHGSVFFSLVAADASLKYEYKAVFCGVEEMTTDYKNNCERLQIPYIYLQKKRGFDLPSFVKLFQLFRKAKPDILFLHGAGFGIIPAFLYKLTRLFKTKLLVRDTQAHHLKAKVEWVWMFFSLLFANKLIVLTEASGEGVKKKFGWLVGKRKIIVIPNGIDIQKFQPHTPILSKQELKIGMQSRLLLIKDHPTLIKAFKIVLEKFPGRGLSLHIAGDGETMNSIRQLIEELQLQGHVSLYGMLGEAELMAFMKSLDIYVQATFGETMSNSIIQALASGLPVIASDVWGVNNMIEHGKNGLLYESANAHMLAEKMLYLIENPDVRNQLGNNARKFAEENYSNKAMFDSYQSLYEY